jgi:hypothetical protein
MPSHPHGVAVGDNSIAGAFRTDLIRALAGVDVIDDPVVGVRSHGSPLSAPQTVMNRR